MSTSSQTTSASTIIEPVVVALGSNEGDRAWYLGRALLELGRVIRLVKISKVHETKPVDAPAGSPDFLNMAVAGLARLPVHELLRALQTIERRLGRVRRGRNAPRVIDLDLIFYGAWRIRTPELTIPHPRYHEREFVLAPLRDLALPWPLPEANR
jgi:2-amino-4-hydroxy-6-hydroxymethyldihydropteridine diphosphokinase